MLSVSRCAPLVVLADVCGLSNAILLLVGVALARVRVLYRGIYSVRLYRGAW